MSDLRLTKRMLENDDSTESVIGSLIDFNSNPYGPSFQVIITKIIDRSKINEIVGNIERRYGHGGVIFEPRKAPVTLEQF